MALEEERTTRDYLYGRLLAVAERIERVDQWRLKEKRPTNAERLMQRFAERPSSTWKTIELSLQPYIQRLGPIAKPYVRLFDQIGGRFLSSDFIDDRPLEGEFLLGYHCQRLWLDKYHSQNGEWVLRSKEEPMDEDADSEDDNK